MSKPSKSKKKVGIKKGLVYLCVCCAAVLILLITGFNFRVYLGRQNVLGVTSETEINNTNEKNFWLIFLRENPSYIDGWLALTKIELSQENYQEAKVYFQKAQVIDPNSQKIRALEENFLNK